MIEPVNELPKLPQARLYLRSAQWGFDELLAKRFDGYAFRFYLIGILASLRAVQHALIHHDSTVSDEHKRVIEDWLQATPLSTPELHFIQTSRNLILKRGAFRAYAINSESSTGEEPNLEITGTSYELAYYDEDGNRQNLEGRAFLRKTNNGLIALTERNGGLRFQLDDKGDGTLAWTGIRTAAKINKMSVMTTQCRGPK
jgi:hypothetical protein